MKTYKEYEKLEDMIEERIPKEFTDGYYPSVEELQKLDMKDLENYLPLLIFFESDPFKDTDIGARNDYNESIKCIRKLLINYTSKLK